MRAAPEPLVLDPDYPRALYRAGTQYKIWGRHVDVMNVESAEDEELAKAEGWHLRPDDVEAPSSAPKAPVAAVAPVSVPPVAQFTAKHVGFGKFEISGPDGYSEGIEGKDAAAARLAALNG